MRWPPRPSQVALVVLSSDRYAALWPVFFGFFFKNWPDCRYRVHLAANRKSYSDPRVACVLSGADADWSASMRASLAQVDATHLLCLMEDMFLTQRVPGARVERLVELAVQSRIEHLQFQPYAYVGAEPAARAAMLRLNERARFRVSLYGLTFWRKEVLTRLLRDGESAWFFELGGTRRSRQLRRFYATTETVVPGMVHGLEKGEWLPEAVAAVGLPASGFPVQQRSAWRRGWRRFKRQAGLRLPLRLQIPLQWALFRLYRAFGYVR
jgi:hypothetical protein